MTGSRKINENGGKSISRKEFLVGGGALIAAVALNACSTKTTTSITSPGITSSSSSPSTSVSTSTALTPKVGGNLNIISDPIPATIGWSADPMDSPKGVVQNCLETLVRGDNKGGVIPWLAESYKIADDLRSITFSLHKGVKFHDGSDFNAVVAQWNLENYIKTGAKSTWSSVDVLDDYTVRVNFKQWDNTLLGSFADASNTAFMVSKQAFDKHGLDWVKANPVGTGPFKFESFHLDVDFNAVKFTDYWQRDAQGRQLPYLDSIKFICIQDPITQKSAMQAGEGDIALSLKTAKEAFDYSALGLEIVSDISTVTYLVPDTVNADSPWANKMVREAAEYAIDREAITKAFGYGYLKTPYQLPPRSSEAYNPDFTLGRQFDLNKAKQLMSEAGYSNGFATTIIVSPGGGKEVATVVQDNLSKIGIRAALDFPEIGKFIFYMGPGTWPKGSLLFMAMPSVGVSYLGVLQNAFSMIGQSWVRTPELMQTLQTALNSTTPDISQVRAVTDLITKDASIIPIIEGMTAYAKAPYVVSSFKEKGILREWNAGETWLNR